MKKTVVVYGNEVELEERTCIYKKCGHKFHVVKKSKQKTCGLVCFDLYHETNSKSKYKGLRRNY
jgi:hypothetical protein